MSKFKPTPSQQAAISARGSAVLVSAGAGSGKTRVLTERLIGFVCAEKDAAELDSFLIISFTRAAAAELRGRITEELAERLAMEPGNKRLRRQSALVQRAQIGTIHSFCANLLRENCHVLGLSPDFKIVDNERAEAMKASALERVLELRYRQPDSCPGFTELADTVGAGRDDKRLAELVIRLYSRMQSHARPELWAKRQIELLRTPAEDAGQTVWGQEILGWAKSTTEYWSGRFDLMIEQMSAHEKIKKAYEPSFSETAAQLRELGRRLNIGWDSAREALPVEFPRMRALRSSPAPQLSSELKAQRELCKKDMQAICDRINADSRTLLDEMRRSADAMEALLRLTLDFDRAFSAEKRRRALLDYSDLEHMAAQLLTNEDDSPTELAVRLSQRYTEIMVDEYQDVSRVQDAIFRALSKNGKNLFMVGDVKQSIYRFRLADPAIFTEKYENFPDCADAAEGEARRVFLRENFRSRREILDCANSVFSVCMTRETGDIDYDERAALVCGADFPDSVEKPELLILDMKELSADEDAPNKLELEARLAAQRILRLFDEGTQVLDGGVMRPLEYGDIAILLRSANAMGGVYRRTLAQYGIPTGSARGSGYFESVEISTLVSMLAVIDDPHQDIPLIAALRFPGVGFSADELAKVRETDRDADFYSALSRAAEREKKCGDFVTLLTRLRAVAPDLSAAELTWQIINELDMLSVCSAMTEGEQRRTNLLEFIELAERFEASGYRGVHRFVLWLRRLMESGKELAAGSASASAVQIVSIHHSKGLEYPVVLLCDTSHSFNTEDSRESVLIHPELGLGPKFYDTELRVEYPTLARNAITLRLNSDRRSEELRLLYVALTRAKERLIMTGVVNGAEAYFEKIRLRAAEPITPAASARAGSMLDWLMLASVVDGGKSFSCRICESPADAAEAEGETNACIADEAARAELERRLSFHYAYAEAPELPSKVTATELKGRAEPDEDSAQLVPKPHSFREPDFTRKDRPVTGAERGVATHLVLQYMDFARANTREGIEAEVSRLKERRFITEREAAAVNAGAIERLFSSDIGRRILNADEIRREFKFSLMCPAEKLFPAAKGEQLLLQGVVDCCITEGEELTVIDYKTDLVRTEAEISERTELYRAQLEAYAEAMERISGKRVRECVLYFLSCGRAVTL